MDPIRVFLAALLTLITAAPPGTDAARLEDARRHESHAFDHLKAGDYEAAIAAFERAYRAFPEPAYLLNLALAFDKWPGHCREAHHAYVRYGAALAPAVAPEKVQARLRALAGECLATLELDVTPAAASVAIDGSAAEPGGTRRIRLPAGQHTIDAAHDGHQPARETVELSPGETKRVSIALVRMEPAVAAAPVAPAADGPGAWVWVTGGVALAAAAAGSAFAISAARAGGEYDGLVARAAAEPGRSFRAEIDGVVRGAERDQSAQLASFAVAGAAALASALIFTFE